MLPGEDAQAFQALIDVYREALQPRNAMEEDGGELASAEDDELLSEDELEASAEEIWASVGVREERSFSFDKGADVGTRQTFDETLVLVKGVLPSIAKVLAEERKSL